MSKIKSILAFVAVLLCGGAWAADPIAVWYGDYSQSNAGFTIDLNGNEPDANGVITIAEDKPIKISWTGTTNPFGDASTGTADTRTKVQVLLRYSDLSTPAKANSSDADSGAVMVSYTGTNNNQPSDYLGNCVIQGGISRGIWATSGVYDKENGNNYDTVLANGDGKHTYVSSYTRFTTGIPNITGKTWEGVTAFVDGQMSYKRPGLKAGYAVDKIYIGGKIGSKTNLRSATGMKIYGIALYNTLEDPADTAAYRFPNEMSIVAEPSEDGALLGSDSFIDTGVAVSSIEKLLNYTFTGVMSGGWVAGNIGESSDHYRTANGYNARKVGESVFVEYQTYESQTKVVLVELKLMTAEGADHATVHARSVGIAYKAVNAVGVPYMVIDSEGGITRINGSTNLSSGSEVPLATTNTGNGYGVRKIVATPANAFASISNTDQVTGSEGVGNWNLGTFTLSEGASGFPVGTVLRIQSISVSANNNPSNKIRLNGVTSEAVTTPSGTSTNWKSSQGYEAKYTFSQEVTVVVGGSYAIESIDASGNKTTTRLRSRPSFSSDDYKIIKYDGQNHWAICVVNVESLSGSQCNVATLNGATTTFDDESIWSGGAPTTVSNVAVINSGNSVITVNSPTHFGSLTLSGSGSLTIKNAQNLKFDSFNATGLDGFTLEYDCTEASMTADAQLCNFIKLSNGNCKFVFKGSGENGATIDFGNGNQNQAICSHIVFDGGSHTFHWRSDSQNVRFGANASESNPTILVTGKASLNFKTQNPCGWGGQKADTNGIVRVNDGSTLTLSQVNGTLYWNQQFYIEPGATMKYDDNSGGAWKVRFAGGAFEDACQIYVPAYSGQSSRVATFTQVHQGLDPINEGTNKGFGIYVGEGAMLDFDSVINENQAVKKFGSGIVNFKRLCSTPLTIEQGYFSHDVTGGGAKNLTISNGASIVFPENHAEGEAYVLCTGTLTPPTEEQNGIVAYIGSEAEKVNLTFDSANKSVAYSLVATASFNEQNYSLISKALAAAGAEATAEAKKTVTLLIADDETITIPKNVILDLNKKSFTGTIKGSGEIVYDGQGGTTVPSFTIGDEWTGIITIKNFGAIGTGDDPAVTSNLNDLFTFLGSRKVKFSGVAGWYTGSTYPTELILENGTNQNDSTGNEYGWRNDNGSYTATSVFPKLSGSGAFLGTRNQNQMIVFQDVSSFTGAMNVTGKRVTIDSGSSNLAGASGQIYIKTSANICSNWTAGGGVVVDGAATIGGNATITGALTVKDGATIDLTKGHLTVDGALTFGNTMMVAGTNLQEGDTVIAVANFTGLLPVLSGNFSLQYIDGAIKLAGPVATVTVSGQEYTFATIANALEASVRAKVPAVLTRDYPGNVSLPAGAILDLGNYSILGSITIASGAYIIENGKPKIDGYATSFDVTYTNVNAFAYRYKNTGSCRSENSNNPGYNNTNEDTSTGALLSGHPWIQDIDQTFFTSTKQLTLATAGVMPTADNTMFTHMGNSNDSSVYGLYLATGDSADEVIVGYNVGSDTNLITKITVPNARSERHSYVITKDDDTTSTPTKTTFVIYLDGLKWKTFERIPRFEITGGFQSGSDYGGALSRGSKIANVGTGDTTSYVNYLRVYNRVISQAEISRYAEVYDYDSPNGTYERSVTANGNWVADNAWTTGESTVEKPASNGNVVLNVDTTGETAATIDVNLTEEVKYEKLTIKSTTGKPVKLTSSVENAKPIKSVCTVIATDVTLGEGAVDLTAGPTIIVEGGKLKFDFSGLQIGEGESFDQILTGDIDETDAVSVIAPTDTSFYFALVYENHHYKAIAREYYQYWPSKDQNVWATAADDEDGDHINKNLCVNEKGTQSSIVADKEVYFDTDHWNNSKVLYLKSIAGAKIRVCEGVVLKIGYSSGDECNLNGATVNIEDGAEVQIAYWTEDSSGTAALKNTVTFNAVGTSKTGKVTLVANAVTAPTLAGDISITAAAKISTTYYSSASAAIDAAGADDTVTLLQDVEGDITISANKLLDAGSHAINGSISVGDAATLTLSGTPTIKGISGSGKVIIDSNGTVVAKNKAGGYAVEDATIQIDRGTFQVALGESGGYSNSSVAGDPSIKNAKFIVGANGTLANNGWVNMEGEISLSADTDKSVFSSTAFRGTPSIVKSGSGAITFTLVRGGGNEAFKFTSLTINGGEFKINALTPTGNLISGVTGKLVLAKTADNVTTYSLTDPVATYNGVDYVTLAAAIDAAGAENIGSIVVHDTNATAPGYRVKDGKVVTTADYYSRWTNTASAAAIIDLKSTASFHNANFAVYYPATDTESEAFNGATTGTPPFGNLPEMGSPWTIFASLINNGANSAYIAPGVALRFTGDVQGALMDATFAPLTFAGFIVEPGATGFGYKSWHASSNRHTEVGRTGYTTHSHISEDFEIYRARENTAMGLTFMGTHVLEIDAQKTFHINDATKDNHNYADENYKTTVEEGGCLKLVGVGTLSVSTLNAAGATIDLSAIGSTETAFIAGNVAVNAATLVYFPADWTVGTAMKLCSGTISGVETSGEVDVKIGEKTEHVILSYDSANGTVSYAYAPTAQTWDNGTIIFDGDLHHLTANQDGTYTKTIGDVAYTINLNGHELVTENGKSYILIKGSSQGNNTTLGVKVTRADTNGTGATVIMRYSDYPTYDTSKYQVAMTIDGSTYENISSIHVADADGNVKNGWANYYGGVRSNDGTGVALDADGDTLMLSYGTGGTFACQKNSEGEWVKLVKDDGHGNNTYNIGGFALGGMFVANNNAQVAAGLKIHAVAVAYSPTTTTTDSKLTSLVWPSEVNAEAKIGKTLFDTVEEAITAATTGENKTVSLNKDIAAGAAIEIPEGVTLDIKGHNLDRAVTGEGTLIINKNVYNNSDDNTGLPGTLVSSLQNAEHWTGEVVLVGGYNHVNMNSMKTLCNANSKLTSKGNKGWLLRNSLENITLSLVDNGDTPALYISNSSQGWGYKMKISGEGTLKVDSAATSEAALHVTDATGFEGNIHMTDLALYFGNEGDVLTTGLIKINSDTTMKVYSGKTWHSGPGGIEVAGTIKGSGTLEGMVAFDEGSTLDLTDGMLTATTATASGAFTVKVSNLAEFLSGEKKVMTLTAGGNTIAAAQVTVTDGTDTAQTTYVLKATSTAAVLVEPESHTWTGATDGSINNAANWGADEMFSGDNQFVVFPADATTKTVSVSDITLGKITINGAYTFTGKGTITLSELEFGNDGSLVLGTGTTLKFPGAINKSLLAKITFAGGTYAFENLPPFTAADVFTVDATNLGPQSYLLASWTDKMSKTHTGYGKPTVNVTGLNSAYSTRVICLVGKIYLQIIDTDAQAKKKTYKIWAVGDSITEGYNSSSNSANYRTQLAAKLALAGYNIEMVGYYDHRNKMPSGEESPAEWSFHSGVSGQRIWSRTAGGGSTNHAGYVDAIDAAIFQVGKDVDVVLVLLGTNDLGNGDTAQHAFEGWKIVVKKILDGCPNAKVVVSPLIDMHGTATKQRTDYNSYISNGITEANFGSAYTRVYNAKLDEYVVGSTENLMFCDVYHPTWDGHDAMSTGWYDAIVDNELIDKDVLAVAPAPKTPAALGVENNAADYAEGFTRIRKLEIPQQVAYALNETPKYSAITEVSDVTKVGYYMELVRDDASDMRYVWVDMDVPAGTTLDKLLVPTGAKVQCVVNNLHVKSNMGSVTAVAKNQDGVNGFLEFSPFGYSGGASNVSGAPARTWNGLTWNDNLADSGVGRGTMQIHRINANSANNNDVNGGEVLFAWNNWGAGNTVAGQKNGEIGIGNFAQHYMADNSPGGIGGKIGLNLTNGNGLSMDYSNLRWDRWGDRMNTKAYTVRNLEIWAKGTVTKHHLMSDEEEVEVAADTESAALAKAVIDVQDSEADSAANEGAGNTQGQAQYLTLVATQVGESNNWKVQAVVDNAKLPENKKIDDTAVAFANAGGIVKLAGATEKQTISIPKTSTTAGLYYSVSFGTTPDNHTQESERVLATSGDGTVDIPVPALGNEKVYYIKVKASATK